jgi:hypothetical protein
MSCFKLSTFLTYLYLIKLLTIPFINFSITELFCVRCNIDITSCVIKLKCYFFPDSFKYMYYSSCIWEKYRSFILWSFSSWTVFSLIVYLIGVVSNVVYALNSWCHTQLGNIIHFTLEKEARDISEKFVSCI